MNDFVRLTTKNDWMFLTYHLPNGTKVKIDGAIIDVRWPDKSVTSDHSVFIVKSTARYNDMGHEETTTQLIPYIEVELRGYTISVPVANLDIRIVKEGT